ncbi:MAG: hypothetical protein LBG31_01985 [Prevotellaceae bacterium]|jgi:uncharacterized protein (TIGR02145 family)|nr:hypothetical protein [Prevotellaceae bacterium]
MKKILFLLALLASITASATVTVTPLSVDYSTQKVTFSVSWTGTAANDRVWIWIDFCPVTGTSPGTYAQAVISGAAADAGSIDAATLNGRGFYVTASPSTVTATLNNAPADKFNWCVYGSDAPPNVTAANGTYTLYGTPPFILTAAGSTATQTVAATSITTSAVTITPVTLTDQTGCPGVFCIYTGSDLYIDGTHLCQTRATGDQNWEAWIRDTRDQEYYRIVYMPDGKWWLAQNVKYAGAGSAVSGCSKDDCGYGYTPAQARASYASGSSGETGNVQGVCPPDWLLPVKADWTNFVNSISTTASVVLERLRALNAKCTGVTNYYGWASPVRIMNGTETHNDCEGFYVNEGDGRHWGLGLDGYNSGCACGLLRLSLDSNNTFSASVRCFRAL